MSTLKKKSAPRYRLLKKDTALDIDRVILAAIDGWRKAYCPYSNFRVGAGLLTKDGSLFGGCNVECADYLGTHAEESALSAMVMAGGRDPEYLVVVGALDSDDPQFNSAPPCGGCRQKLWEFAEDSNNDLNIIVGWDDDGYEYVLLSDVLPDPFGPVSIGIELGRYK